MGLIPSHLHLLAIEQHKHPMKGDVLTSGQLAMYETLEDVKNIFVSHGIMPKQLPEGFDTKNKIPACVGTPRENFTNAGAMLSMLGAEKVFVFDVSNYEGADYVIDLNYDVDPKYHERFDVILDSGTLEHVFDTSCALANYVKMLKKGGRLIFFLPCSNAINHGFYSLQPNVFFDFFGANGFSDFNCYLMEESSFNVYKKSKIYRYDYISSLTEYPISTKNTIEVCFFATKNSDANLEKIQKPIQGMYLEYNWGKKNVQASALSNPSASGAVKRITEFYKRKWEFSTRRFRPEFIDRLWKSKRRKKNLTYLGKF